MADEGSLAQASVNGGSEHAASNGAAPPVAERIRFDDLADRVGHATGQAVRLAQDVAGGIAGRLGRSLQRRLTADLDDRDPDYIRENLSLSWLVASLWYRAEVRNLGNIPERGRVLLVGNHTGGNLSPETIIFTLAFSTYFGVERRYHQLAHNLVLASPLGPFLRRFGTVAASHANARKALEADAAVLVFPGGDWEVHRPSWQSSRIDFGGRKGFVRLALEQDAPIVPVVTIGGQETALWLDRGAWLARLLAPRQDDAPQGPADPNRPALGPHDRGLPAPDPAAGEDDDRGAPGDRRARALRARAGRGRGLRVRDRPDAGNARRPRGRAALPGDRVRDIR